VRARRSVEQQEERHPDADEQPGQRVKDEHAEERGERRDEVRSRGDTVDAPEAPGVEAVELDQRANVDELDQRGDHDRCQRRLGQLLEEPGEEEQGHDRERRDDEPRDL
jgi:hypothetical protein